MNKFWINCFLALYSQITQLETTVLWLCFSLVTKKMSIGWSELLLERSGDTWEQWGCRWIVPSRRKWVRSGMIIMKNQCMLLSALLSSIVRTRTPHQKVTKFIYFSWPFQFFCFFWFSLDFLPMKISNSSFASTN